MSGIWMSCPTRTCRSKHSRMFSAVQSAGWAWAHHHIMLSERRRLENTIRCKVVAFQVSSMRPGVKACQSFTSPGSAPLQVPLILHSRPWQLRKACHSQLAAHEQKYFRPCMLVLLLQKRHQNSRRRVATINSSKCFCVKLLTWQIIIPLSHESKNQYFTSQTNMIRGCGDWVQCDGNLSGRN